MCLKGLQLSHQGLDLVLEGHCGGLVVLGEDREKCRAALKQPKQPKTLLVLNQGGAGYETEADLMYQAQQAANTLSNKQTVGQRHPNFRTKLNKT